ncbi:MAG: SDR family oxidoreductase [Spirochaetales bacterium]|jgi:NAD(P)-dependent dehydrogenase (short-subunit alcohol dehydrogenase family)|nr:SDR family oxidoreductase [Spirochaetales bacterium]
MDYIAKLFSLEGKNIIITGGAGSIAGVLAAELVKAGARVCLWGRGTNHPVAEAVERVNAAAGRPGRVFGVTVDAGVEGEIPRAIAETEGLMGAPNALINGAGGNRGKGPFVDVDVDLFKEIVDMNLLAGFIVPTKFIAKYWIEKKIEGSIVNFTSMGSYVPLSGTWAYCSAKSAILNMTQATAKEFAPYGIRVNAVAPGFFIGHQNKALLIKDEASGELTERGKAVIAHTPFGRFGKHEELAGAMIFLLASAASGFVTGVSLPVDGGYLVQNI